MTAQQKGGARFDILNTFLMKMMGAKGTAHECEILVGIMYATAKEARERGYILHLSKDGEVRAVLGAPEAADGKPLVITSASVMGKMSLDDILKIGRRKITPKKGGD